MMTFDELKELVKFCTSQTTCDFYRHLYGLSHNSGSLELTNWDEWKALPYLTKEELLKKHIWEKCFLPPSEVDWINVSTGTSGGSLLFTPRSFWPYSRGTRPLERYYDHLTMGSPWLTDSKVTNRLERLFGSFEHPARVVAYDHLRPELSVRLAKIGGVKNICLYPSYLPTVAKYMSDFKMTKDIELIELSGEVCGQSLFSEMRKAFSRAWIIDLYGAGEIGGIIAYSITRPGDDDLPKELQPANGSLLELVDPHTKEYIEPEAGVEGELVVTISPKSCRGGQTAFPMIRYRTGDMVRVVERKISAPGDFTFKILGRAAMDFLKIPGGMLRSNEIERVLRTLPDEVTDIFEMSVKEKPKNDRVFIEAVLKVQLHKQTDMKTLAKKIADKLRVSASYSYADGVRDGYYAPLVCVPFDMEQKTKGPVKHKRLIKL